MVMGSFIVKTGLRAQNKIKQNKLNYSVGLNFQITQHFKDIQLIENLRIFLDCGALIPYRNAIDLRVWRFSDLTEKIIPLFQKHPLVGFKYLDFLDFCKVAEIMKANQHLTVKGLNQIMKIKNGINSSR